MYEKLSTGAVRYLLDGGVFWPNDNTNPASLEYDAWIAAGNAAPDAEMLVVPATVAPLQARRALRQAGLLEMVNAWVATQPDDDIKDAWDFALAIERNGPITLGAATALGLTDAKLDSLFVAAAGY